MKKVTRNEKTKLIEKAKTFVIALLFLLCLFLGYRILRLYNAQANVESVLWGGNASDTVDAVDSGQYKLKVTDELPQPDLIAANSIRGRMLIEDNDKSFAALSNQIIGELYGLKSDEIIGASKEEWEAAFNTDSVYVRYPVERFSDFEAALYGIKSNSISDKIQSYTQVLFAAESDKSVTVFVAEQNDGRFIKAKLDTDTAKSICGDINKLTDIEKKEYAFAYELNLDQPSNRERVMLDPMLLIPVGEEKAPEIQAAVPRVYKAGLNFTKATDLTVGLINTFGYNPNTIRQYVNSDDSIMFVGETGSLSLHPGGLIEYKALDAEDGVTLDKAGAGSLKNILTNLCGMLEKVMRISGINTNNADFTLKLTGMPKSYRSEVKTEIDFDYFINGNKLEFKDSYGVRAVLQKGNLVELRMQLKNIERQNKQEYMKDMLDTIDEFCAINKNYKRINRVYGVYRYEEGAAELNAEWKVEGAK